MRTATARAQTMTDTLPSSWQGEIGAEMTEPYFRQLAEFLRHERERHTVYPPEREVFSAFRLTPFRRVNVVILGQDPYPGENQAHGLAFSVRPGVRPPPSLMNIFKELHDDLGCSIPNNGYLVPWAEQGVLLLNVVLTVRAHAPNSHRNKGWEKFTDAAVERLSADREFVVFVLWGGNAQRKAKLIDRGKHLLVRSAHPSPLSARNGFFRSRPFSRINEALRNAGKKEIDWQIPDL